jgi:hypothetical protein
MCINDLVIDFRAKFPPYHIQKTSPAFTPNPGKVSISFWVDIKNTSLDDTPTNQYFIDHAYTGTLDLHKKVISGSWDRRERRQLGSYSDAVNTFGNLTLTWQGLADTSSVTHWSPGTHHRFPKDFKRVVFTLLLIHQREDEDNPIHQIPKETVFHILTYLAADFPELTPEMLDNFNRMFPRGIPDWTGDSFYFG